MASADDKMSLIVFEATGHVLGGFTRTADPEGVSDPAAAAGDGLWIRDPGTGELLAVVEPQYLAIETVDRRDEVLLSHRRFAVVDGAPEELSAVTPTAVLDGTNVTVTLPDRATAEVEAWVVVEGEEQRVVEDVTIPSGETASTPKPLTLASGDYGVLILAPGYGATVAAVSVP